MGNSPWMAMRRRLAHWIWPEDQASGPDHTGPGPQPGAVTGGDPQQAVSLVIAGGGSRSSFQVGALRYLYDKQQITPSLISATSAGSILGAVLAQHSDHDGQRRALGQLEQIWLGMHRSSDMFSEQPWFTALRQHIPTWRRVMALRQRPANRATLSESLADLLAKPRSAVQRLTGGTEHDENQLGPAPTGSTDPADLRAGATAQIHTPPEHEPTWTPANALETLSTLWEAGRSSADLDFIVRGAQEQRSAFTPGPIVEQLLQPEVFQPARTAESATALRIAVVSLESGELCYVDGRGHLRDRTGALLPSAEAVDVAEAVRASCAIPGVFPPVALGAEHYVDGGVRENVPAEIALSAGPSTCYVVVAAPNGVPPEGSYAEKDLMAIILRTTAGIMTDEVQRDEVAYARHRGAVVIQPELDIHDLVTIDPGLVSIAMDYGYLRAADVCEQAGAQRLERTREVIQLRRLIWTTEDELFNPTGQQTSVQLADIAELKLKLKYLVEDPGSAHLPPEASGWWQQWERHPFTIDQAPTWLDQTPPTPQPE